MSQAAETFEKDLAKARTSLSEVLFSSGDKDETVLQNVTVNYLNAFCVENGEQFHRLGSSAKIAKIICQELLLVSGFVNDHNTKKVNQPDEAHIKDMLMTYLSDERAKAMSAEKIPSIGRAVVLTLASYVDNWSYYPTFSPNVIEPLGLDYKTTKIAPEAVVRLEGGDVEIPEEYREVYLSYLAGGPINS